MRQGNVHFPSMQIGCHGVTSVEAESDDDGLLHHGAAVAGVERAPAALGNETIGTTAS